MKNWIKIMKSHYVLLKNCFHKMLTDANRGVKNRQARGLNPSGNGVYRGSRPLQGKVNGVPSLNDLDVDET